MKVGLETLIVEKRKKEVRKIYFEEKFYRFLNNKTHSIKFFQGLILCSFLILYSMKIKEQTRKLAVGCSKHCFEVVDRTDEVSNHTYGKAKLTWFEEIFEEY